MRSVMVFAMARTGQRRRQRPASAEGSQGADRPASAEAFSALGFHGVSMEAIATRVGSPPPRCTAITRASTNCSATRCSAWVSNWWTARHSPTTRRRSGETLWPAHRLAHRHRDGQPGVRRALPLGGPVPAGRRPSHADSADAHRPSRIQRPLTVIRPELTSRQRWTLSTAALSVVGSIVDHRAKLPAIQVSALLAELADAVLAAELPRTRDDAPSTPTSRRDANHRDTKRC